MARQLVESLKTKQVAIVHLVRFPQLTINHGILLWSVVEQPDNLLFTAYDPNIPDHPVTLTFNFPRRTFYFPRNHYWVGGRLNVIETYRNWFY
jgi:hypothetical protein